MSFAPDFVPNSSSSSRITLKSFSNMSLHHPVVISPFRHFHPLETLSSRPSLCRLPFRSRSSGESLDSFDPLAFRCRLDPLNPLSVVFSYQTIFSIHRSSLSHGLQVSSCRLSFLASSLTSRLSLHLLPHFKPLESIVNSRQTDSPHSPFHGSVRLSPPRR